MTEIVVVGGGFAGLWAALLAVRESAEQGAGIGVTLVSRDDWLTLRPRLYEPGPENFRTRLSPILHAVGARFVAGEAVEVDTGGKRVLLADGNALGYDRLVLAAGSVLAPLPIAGAAEFGFDLDTWQGAMRLDRHLAALAEAAAAPGGDDAVILGAGFTGIEIAAEMRGRIAAHAGDARAARARVVLLDRAGQVGPELGAGPRPEIERALAAAGVELRLGAEVAAVDAGGVTLADGGRIAAKTVLLATGLRASPLAATLGLPLDELGRLPVDDHLRVVGLDAVYAAGDVARARCDEAGHLALMSCQHAMFMGRYAGHNAARDLLGLAPAPYRQERYVTCLDLGPAGAVFTRGWERTVELTGEAAKRYKRTINGEVIYPPTGDRAAILAAATLVPQHHRKPPETRAAE